jgi:Glycosyltransferase family 25 (LPS biosynthesis protein)
VKNSKLWASFDEVYCLTLEGDVERQRHASAELCAVGLRGFKFIDGINAKSPEVVEAYRSGNVHAFPPCFRCGLASCGSAECNNILIEPQVGCYLSFMKIFRRAASSNSNTFLVVEDDIKFPDYAQGLAAIALTNAVLGELGFFSPEPCLIGLGRGISPGERLCFEGQFEFLPRRKQPQNPCFAFNRAFAEFALYRFRTISHTVDVYIHFQLSDEARHYSLEPPLAYELSSSTGTLPSRIHPKPIAFENPSNDHDTRATAKAAFEGHLKHVKNIPVAVIGGPRGGTGFMAHALKQFGWDIGHESLGADGISSWLFAVSDVDLPFGEDLYARNSRFVYADRTIAVVRTSPQAVFSLQMENAKNIQSYCFRRRWIKSCFDVDLDSFKTDFECALGAYVFWYRIVILRRPVAWICLERASEDLPRLFAKLLEKRREPHLPALREVRNARKPYLGQVYEPISGDFSSQLKSADPFLREQYALLKNELCPLFYGCR